MLSRKNLHKPRFVANIPIYVDKEVEGESSDEEDDGSFSDQDFEFDTDNPEEYPFRTFKLKGKDDKKSKIIKIPGKKTDDLPLEISEDDKLRADGKLTKFVYPKISPKSSYFIRKFQETAFDDQMDDLDQYDRVKIVIGLNRMHSISSRKNKILTDEIALSDRDKNDYKIENSVIGFYWHPVWLNNKDNGKVDYKIVRKFYKQLKKKSPEKASKFLESESQVLPPYQDIREFLRKSEKTKQYVINLREIDDEAPIYYMTMDSDMISANGVISSYTRISMSSYPKAMSTGYIYPYTGDKYPFFFASIADLNIRYITSKFCPWGVYLPEPNSCFLIPANEQTLPYSFLDPELPNKSLESISILRKILKSLEEEGISLEKEDIIFLPENSIVTSIPFRALYTKNKKTLLKFSPKFINGGKPDESDAIKLEQISQCTLNVRVWVDDLYFSRYFKLGKGENRKLFSIINDLVIKKLDEDISEEIFTQKINDLVKNLQISQNIFKASLELKKARDSYLPEFQKDLYEYLKLSEISEELDVDLNELYELSNIDKNNLIKLYDSDDLFVFYEEVGNIDSILEIYSEDPDKLYNLLSDDARDFMGAFGIDFEQLKEIYDDIINAGGSFETFNEFTNLGEDSLFEGDYGEVNLEDAFSELIERIEEYKEASEDSWEEYDFNISPMQALKNIYYEKFHREHGESDQDSDHEYNHGGYEHDETGYSDDDESNESDQDSDHESDEDDSVGAEEDSDREYDEDDSVGNTEDLDIELSGDSYSSDVSLE